MQHFLENNIPKTKKSKQTVVLGVVSSGLASTISEKLGINCISSLVVTQILRGMFPLFRFVKEIVYLKINLMYIMYFS